LAQAGAPPLQLVAPSRARPLGLQPVPTAMSMFSDDAYNKSIGEDVGQGTLVGNWFEERVLRESVGEGRSVPQRHLPRSGLLKDFTKTPASGPRKMDNTFERCTGPKVAHSDHQPSSTIIGTHDQETMNHVGPQEHVARTARFQAAEQAVATEEEILARKDQERSFETTHGVTYSKPDDSQTERPTHLRKGCMEELRQGPLPDRMLALGNEGLDFYSHTHYSNMEGTTQARLDLGDPVGRSNLKVTAVGGVRAFGKHREFTKPVDKMMRGMAKDEEVASIFEGLKHANPLRVLQGSEPRAGAFATVPSLASVKTAIHDRIGQAWGSHGYVMLRQRLFDYGDHESFISKADATSVFRDQLGLTPDEVPDQMLDAYISQLVTMKKSELKINTLLSSLRPVLMQKDKRRVIETFKAMDTHGSVRLGDWLSRLTDDNLRKIIVAAFGAQDEEMVTDMPLTEAVFLEVLSDLAPFMDIQALLA